jgi:Ca2+ transporting ATPase
MCTGDNIDTAIAISKNAKILPPGCEIEEYTCMTGKEFRETVGGLITVQNEAGEDEDRVKNMSKFREVKSQLRVLARSSPEDKYLLVTGIQHSEGVVAVTGDGTNDAPALTKADVGFAMGITGTDIAKGACDIILLDDNFTSIVVALRYGRSVYDNVRKFLQFQLSVNVVAMFMCFFGTVILKDSPLNAVQLLWVNLVMDTLGALALATEPPSKNILERPPYKKDNAIVTEQMWRNVFGHAIWQIILLSWILLGGQGVFCENYNVKCFKFDAKDNKLCLEYNPFFSNDLYIKDDEIASWTALNLEASSFNKEALEVF